MENIIGIIEEKKESSGLKADGTTPWKRASFKVAGITLATFDENIIRDFDTGKNVEVDYEITETQGKHYNNIQTMKLSDGKPTQTTPPIQTANNYSNSAREDCIIRQSCLKSAAQVLVAIKDSDNVKKAISEGKLMDLFLNTTEALVDYAKNGIQIKAEEKPLEEKEKDEKETKSSSMPDY